MVPLPLEERRGGGQGGGEEQQRYYPPNGQTCPDGHESFADGGLFPLCLDPSHPTTLQWAWFIRRLAGECQC